MKVGIVGGGILGLSLAYYLSREGVEVAVFEGRARPGGLLDYVDIGDARIDKYYHCILSSDVNLLALIQEVGLQDFVRFAETKQGVYRRGRLYSMTNAKDFLLFPPLSLIERLRLGLTILAALRVDDWRQLEAISVEDWIVGLGGRGTFEKLWKPLLKAKFDGRFQHTPATYIWSRLKRVSSTRTAAGQKELMGYFVGSYKVFIDRLVERIRARGSSVRLEAPVRQLLVLDGRVAGLVLDEEKVPLDAVIVTVPLPILHDLLPEHYRKKLDVVASSEYLGVVCGVLLLDRSLTPYYTLNIADDEIPFTGIIETTNLISPQHVGGYHLVYLPKYAAPDSAYMHYSDAELRTEYIACLKQMFPDFDEAWVKHLFVFRERFVEPLHLIGKRRPILPVRTGLPGLFVVNSGQIYPQLTNCQSSVRHVLHALPALLEAAAARLASESSRETEGCTQLS